MTTSPLKRLTWRPVIMTGSAAIIGFLLLPLAAWQSVANQLLLVLSIFAAATLVRLARPLPFTNPAAFSRHELNTLANAMEYIAKSLRLLIYVIVVAMAALVIVPLKLLPDAWPAIVLDLLGRMGSALIGSLVGFVVARVSQVIESDISLINLQRRILVTAIDRVEHQKSNVSENEQTNGIAGLSGYGKKLVS